LDNAQTAQVLEFSLQVGKLLLKNGAEISRVEETMERICKAYGIKQQDEFVLSNGIFLTCDAPGHFFAKVQHIPVGSTRLDLICELNALSRKISEGKLSFAQAQERLKEIEAMPPASFYKQSFASALGAAAFAVFFGGSLFDGAAAFVCGFLLYIFCDQLGRHTRSKIVRNLIAGLFIALFCSLMQFWFIQCSLHAMIIGSIMPLIPGVAFCNAIREIGDEDYIAGFVRLMDVLLVFISIAIGIGVGLVLFGRITGQV
jgi:uncharacterized membrane protein YjjP (DUF1212 family)